MTIDNPEIFLKLLCAHLIGDFVLQPNRWVAQKEKEGLRSPLLYLHALVHGLLAWLLVWQADFWAYAMGITVIHLLIDAVKSSLHRHYPEHPKTWFLLDQALHLLVLAGVWSWYTESPVSLQQLPLNWVLLTAYLFVTTPASILIKVLLGHWKVLATKAAQSDQGLARAGAWIGVLERLMVLTFILTNHWEAIGFLLAAKSVFRFGDLKNSKEVHLTEYILIGSLLSFGVAIVVGLLVRNLS